MNLSAQAIFVESNKISGDPFMVRIKATENNAAYSRFQFEVFEGFDTEPSVKVTVPKPLGTEITQDNFADHLYFVLSTNKNGDISVNPAHAGSWEIKRVTSKFSIGQSIFRLHGGKRDVLILIDDPKDRAMRDQPYFGVVCVDAPDAYAELAEFRSFICKDRFSIYVHFLDENGKRQCQSCHPESVRNLTLEFNTPLQIPDMATLFLKKNLNKDFTKKDYPESLRYNDNSLEWKTLFGMEYLQSRDGLISFVVGGETTWRITHAISSAIASVDDHDLATEISLDMWKKISRIQASGLEEWEYTKALFRLLKSLQIVIEHSNVA